MNHIPRREFIKISGALGAGLAAWPLTSRAAEGGNKSVRPNILVFLSDDHGQWAQRCYGNSELVTPNMDRLAARGVRMRQTFTTCPVCSPARASFFTGRMPSQHGIHDWLAPKFHLIHPALRGQTLISELLKNAGYHTALIGKWHCGRNSEPQPGFDRWFTHWEDQKPHKGTQHFSDQGKPVTEGGLQSPFFTQQAVDFLNAHKQKEGADGQPFFLFISYCDTHAPHSDAPPDLLAKYDNAKFNDIPDEQFAACHGTAGVPADKNPERERSRQRQYYGAVSSIDREMGKVLAALEANGQLENTLIFYTGDHGLNTGHHGMWEKGNATQPQNILEESIRIACTVSWPAGGVRQNVVCDDLVSHPDLWATLLDIAGAAPDAITTAKINSPGVSYARQLRGEMVSSWRQTIFSEYGNARMARTERYKLIRRYPFHGVSFPDELYDLKADPRETKNFHDDPALKPVVEKLSAELDQFFAKYSVAGNSGLEMEQQTPCTNSPWMQAAGKGKKESEGA